MQIKCCKDCSRRYVGCHAECKSYQAERRALTAFNEKRFIESEMTAATDKVQWFGVSVRKRRG